MSRLGNLFGGGGNSDSNDALKYSAPKEPKTVRAAAPAAASSAVESPKPFSPMAASPAKPLGPSKIMASATVRLFKVNPATNAYDAVDGGSHLGCVIMGTGLTYQILIYNGQKVPQATIVLTSTLDYTIRDLYMSLADTNGNAWSILFDNADVMTVCLRTIVAAVAHLASHSESPASTETIQRSLPGTAEGDSEVTLSAGMAAGIYCTAWELGAVSDYPSDALLRPLRQVQAPMDMIKIKLTSGVEDVVGGLTTALLGCRKGDKFMLAVSPKVAFLVDGATAFVSTSSRAFPGSWLLLEVEVAKVKSESSGSGKSDKKKDKNKASSEPIAVPTVPAQSQGQQYASNDIDESDAVAHSGSGGTNSDLKDRMARMSRSSGTGGSIGTGGAGQMANIMQAAASSQQRKGSFDGDSHNNILSHGNNNQGQGNKPQNQQNIYSNNNSGRQQQRQDDNYNNNNNDNADNNHYSRGGNNNHGNSYGNNNNHNQNRGHNNNYNNNNYNQNHHHHQQQQNNEYALTLVEGQESRSYYDNNDNNNYDNGGLHNRGANERRSAPAPAQAAPSVDSSPMLQQSMMIVQQSIMQLHSKLDQVGAQVNQSVTLQQQQAATTAVQAQAVVPGAANGMHGGGVGSFPGASPYGATMPGMAGMAGMPGGMTQQQHQQNPYLFQQQQQQQQQLQMMQMQQQAAAHAQAQFVLATTGVNSAVSGVRLKSDELVANLRYIVEEYETAKKESGQGSSVKNAEQLETITTLKATVARLEEKNETLLARNEKLMTEKSTLLEKQSDLIQTGSESSNKLYAMQNELESLRREKQTMLTEMEGLRTATTNASARNNQEADADRAQIYDLTNRVTALQNEAVDLKHRNADLEHSKEQTVSDLKQRLEASTNEIESLQGKLTNSLEQQQILSETAAAAASAAASAAAASATAAVVDFSNPEIQSYVSEKIDEACATLRAEQTTDITNAQNALSAEQIITTGLRAEVTEWVEKFNALQSEWVSSGTIDKTRADGLQAKVTELEQALTEAVEKAAFATATATANATSGGGDGKASEEELKSIMQDIYVKACELFDIDNAEDDLAYSPKDVVKRLRAVLKNVTTERTTANSSD